jgi:hypothetical protein
MALAVCGGLFFPRLWAWAIPLGALLISDLVLDLHYGVPFLDAVSLAVYVSYAAAIALGIALRRNPRWYAVLGASLAASLLFYLVTNSAAWLHDVYAKTPAGWWQAMTTGLPGYPPTWTFFRNSAASDLLFTAVYLGAMALSHTPVPARTEFVAAR